jgi:hypothetical protein
MPKRTRQNKKRNTRKSRKQRGGNAPFCLKIGTEYKVGSIMREYLGPKQDAKNPEDTEDPPIYHKFGHDTDEVGFAEDDLNKNINIIY